MSANNCFPFFVGRGRSGTTLVRMMFDAHPEMAIARESHFPVAMALARRRFESGDTFLKDKFLGDLFSHWAFKRWELPPEEVLSAFDAYSPDTLPDAIRVVYRAYATHQGKSRYGEKTPGFVLHIPLLARLFPESRFVHIIRDGRNVALSYLEGGWGPRDLEEAAIYWKRFVERGRTEGRKLGPSRYTEVRYEDLVENTEAELRRLCDFIGLSFDERMLLYFRKPSPTNSRRLALKPHINHPHPNLALPPTKGLRDWRLEMTAEDAAIFEALAADLLAELGYERSEHARSPLTRVRALRVRAIVTIRRARRRVAKRLRSRTISRQHGTA